MKKLYVLAAAVSITGGMAFAAPGAEEPGRMDAVLDVQIPRSDKDRKSVV